MIALQVQGLGVDGPQGAILSGVNFELRQGATLCILGESGGGKSLLAAALFGLLPPGLRAQGAMTLAGGRRFNLADPAALHALWGNTLFLLPQEPNEALDPTMTLLGQVAEAVRSGDRRAAALRRLAAFGLDRTAAADVPAALSGGMAQRALLAIAAEVAAPVLVADEPTKGLDAARRAAMLRALNAMTLAGRALLMVTHDLDLPQALDAGLLVLSGGAAVEAGRAREIVRAPRHSATRDLLSAQPGNWPPPAPARPAPPVLMARSLSFAWPGRQALFQGIDLTLRPGEILGVAGPSGIGKSTLCDVILGLRKPGAGRVAWPAGRRAQRLFQDPAASFPPHRPLRRVFASLAAVTEDPVPRLIALLPRLGLAPALLDRRAGEISGGEAQRLALARALLLRPSLLIADEPTSRLDAVSQAGIAAILRDLAKDGMAILLVTHDEAMLAALAHRVIRMDAPLPQTEEGLTRAAPLIDLRPADERNP